MAAGLTWPWVPRGSESKCGAWLGAWPQKVGAWPPKRNNPGTGPQTREIGPIGPQRATRGWPGALPKIPENWEIVQKLGFGKVWGETGTSKHILGTIQSIWVAGFPRISNFEQLPKQDHVFGGDVGRDGGPAVVRGGARWGSAGQISEIQGTL